MNLQILKDNTGKQTGVYVPIDDWALIKSVYPDIEEISSQVPTWEQELIDERLQKISQQPDRLVDADEFMKELKKRK
jgi:hypothetical protein